MAHAGHRQGFFSSYLKKELRGLTHELLQLKADRQSQRPSTKEKKTLAIIGAGAAGLYTAYTLTKKFPERFDITIFEQEETRVGGRVYTKKITEEPFQYGEFGAMRIPETHTTVNTLVKDLGLDNKNDKIEFHIEDNDELLFINGKKNGTEIMTKEYARLNPGLLGFMSITIIHEGPLSQHPGRYNEIVLLAKPEAPDLGIFKTVPDLYFAIWDELLNKMVPAGSTDPTAESLANFVEQHDKYTVVSYTDERIKQLIAANFIVPIPAEGAVYEEFSTKLKELVDSVLHFGEVWDTASGHNLLGLVDSAIAILDFRAPSWYTINHGLSRITTEMESFLKSVKPDMIKMGVRVTGLSKILRGRQCVTVTYSARHLSSPAHETFDAVLVTAPFGSVRMFDLLTMGFSYGKRQAIRTLQYDHSTKIFVQFNEGRWWESKNFLEGGSSRTDLPVRTVVYPSYGLSAPATDPHILLASYTWANDAVIWGNTDKHTLKEVVLRDINILHGTNFEPKNFTDEQIAVHTWLEGYALFGPDQFRLMIDGMIPEHGVYFAGEHLSMYHAWIFGAINSAARAVCELLLLEFDDLNITYLFNLLLKDGHEFDLDSFTEYINNL